MFELVGEIFPARRQHDQRGAGLVAGGFIRQLQHGTGAFPVVFRASGPYRLSFFHADDPVSVRLTRFERPSA